VQGLDRPGLRPGGKSLFGQIPGVIKEMRTPVVVKVRFGIPPTVGKKDLGIVLILPQLQVGAAFKIPDERFAFFKERLKGFNLLFAEYHFNNANDHSCSLVY
jgi:hypothetical protein